MSSITPEKFCEIWAIAHASGKTLDHVVQKVGKALGKQVTRKYVTDRAARYRRQGVVMLKSFSR